jgi:GNAT superfamily N-acetyltransferase
MPDVTPSDDYTVLTAIPALETYRRLRSESGLTPMSTAAAARGLPNSLFAVQVLQGDVVAGMGRVIGDGGCFCQITDICVLPAHRGRGLAHRIMASIRAWIERELDPACYVSLIADGEAHRLYARFGFVPTAPRSIGMYLQREPKGPDLQENST